MRIAVVGSGYVGLVAGACLADLGHDVMVVDNDQEKLAALRRGEVPIHEQFLPELLQRHRDRRLHFSDDLHAAVRASSAIFVAVGTPPTDSGDADLSFVESVAREISGAIDEGGKARSTAAASRIFKIAERAASLRRKRTASTTDSWR